MTWHPQQTHICWMNIADTECAFYWYTTCPRSLLLLLLFLCCQFWEGFVNTQAITTKLGTDIHGHISLRSTTPDFENFATVKFTGPKNSKILTRWCDLRHVFTFGLGTAVYSTVPNGSPRVDTHDEPCGVSRPGECERHHPGRLSRSIVTLELV